MPIVSDDFASSSPLAPPFQHHVLISSGGGRLCRHLREAATLQTAALYLGPTAFRAPFDEQQLRRQQEEEEGEGEGEEKKAAARAYMAYLTDPTRLIANPGLRAGVRADAALLGRATAAWREHTFASPLNNYIVRRRAATPAGVLLAYPGAAAALYTDTTHGAPDFVRAAWFQRAIMAARAAADKKPATVVVGPPRLDPGGAGFTVTMSLAVSAPATNRYWYMMPFLLKNHSMLVVDSNLAVLPGHIKTVSFGS
jgi:hypothetical protein